LDRWKVLCRRLVWRDPQAAFDERLARLVSYLVCVKRTVERNEQR
jgi:hypothetical protein